MEPGISLPLEWVGIENLESNVSFTPLFPADPNPVHITCSVDLYTSLSGDKRGVHLSRFSEAFFKIKRLPPRPVLQFCRELSREIRKTQNQKYGRVRLHSKHFVEKETSITSKPTLFPLRFGADVIASPSNTIYLSSTAITIITVCPCGLEMSKASKGFSSTKSRVSDFRNSFSHTQRATLEITVTSRKPFSYEYLLQIAEDVAPFVSVTLKRPDEFDLIRKVYKDSMFCEDIVRKALKKTNRYLKNPNLDCSKFRISVRSEESIHPFSVVTYGELNKDSLD